MVIEYQFEFAICPQPLNTVILKGPPAMIELLVRGMPDDDGDMGERDPTLVTNVQPLKVLEKSDRAIQDQIAARYPARAGVLREVWRDFGAKQPEQVEDLEWFQPETGYSRDYDFHLRSGGTLESWLAGDTADALLDLKDGEENPDGTGDNPGGSES